MASSRTCRADSPNGEYRCLFVASPQGADGGGQYVAQALDAYLVNPDGVQTKLGVTPVDATGATESAALSNACVEFAAWVSHRPRL
ncbi:MAG: hypothetical protein IT181_17310 [Acidobacteria bacterium]|nr:hypothetical protein [Acidobacteriota bacterium]